MQSGNRTMIQKNKPLVVILGPTAVGKTEISLQLAERFGGEIISADSRLIYKGMDIGTAKPSSKERKRIPHHLIDVASPDEIWTLAKFQRAVYKAIEEIHERGIVPFLVGGTGQYIRCITEGWIIPEVKPDPRLRNAIEQLAEELGAKGIHDGLSAIDPEAANKIDPTNLRRSIRALEVIYHTGRLFSDQKKKSKPGYELLFIGINRPRAELYERIDERIHKMVEDGLVSEVEALLEEGYPPDLPSFSAIGYRQIIQVLQGEIRLEEALVLMKRLTRQFVRRQANWFKLDDPTIIWFQAGTQAIHEINECIDHFLNSNKI